MRTERIEPFPDPRRANPWGPLAIGGDLRPERLVLAYRSGIFPWYSEGEPIQWWSPDPRAIFDLDGPHVSRSLARTLRRVPFEVSRDQRFGEVIRACAVRPGTGTWITRAMRGAYEELHRRGIAHSLEVWLEGALAGGIYGVAIGGFFAGESMFHRATDASKVALVCLIQHLRERGYALFDTQVLSPHTRRMGAYEISRRTYLDRLERAVVSEVRFGDPAPPAPIAWQAARDPGPVE